MDAGHSKKEEENGEELPKALAPKESTPTKAKTPSPPSLVTQRIPSTKTPSTQETPQASSYPATQEATSATSPRSKDNLTSQETAIDITLNLKRRKDGG